MTLSDFSRMIAPLTRKVMLIFGRGILKKVNNTGETGLIPSSGTNPQRVQLEALAGEILTDVERWQNYGFESYPKADAEILIGAFNGNRSLAQAIAVQDHRYRPNDLSEGDACLYDANGARILCTDGEIRIGNKTTSKDAYIFDADGARILCTGGKVAMGNKTTGKELLDLFDQLLTVLQADVNIGGIGSATKLVTALSDLALIQTDLQNIKGSL